MNKNKIAQELFVKIRGLLSKEDIKMVLVDGYFDEITVDDCLQWLEEYFEYHYMEREQ